MTLSVENASNNPFDILFIFIVTKCYKTVPKPGFSRLDAIIKSFN